MLTVLLTTSHSYHVNFTNIPLIIYLIFFLPSPFKFFYPLDIQTVLWYN